jgi:uncharacterized protein
MDTFDASGVTGIVWRRVDPARETDAEALMKKLLALSRGTTGFLGSEIFPPIHGVQDAYVVLYRFDRGENLRHWLQSNPRAELLAQMEEVLLEPSFEFFFTHRRRSPGTASTILSYTVRAGSEESFRQWQGQMQEAVRSWPGFLGTETYDTLENTDRPEVVVIVRFDSRQHLDAWLESEVRAGLLREARAFVDDYRVRRIGSGFEGWFDVSEDQSPPAAWRQGLVILSVLFPLIMILRKIFAPLFIVLPFPLAFLILLTVDVAILSYLIMPYFSRAMAFWLRPGPPRSLSRELLGWLIVLGLPAITLAAALRAG